MATMKIKCIHCGSEEVIKVGKQKNGTPRCKCKKCQKTFQTEYVNKGALPETKKMIIKMAVNGSGIRDTARVLGISKDTVMKHFKKTEKSLTSVNPKYVNLEEPLTVRLEMDEMWRRVYSKETPCWLWHAINHENGELIAYVLGSRAHGMLQQLLELLNSVNLNIVSVYSDNNFAYHDIISPETLQTGKKNTQKIERKHLTFRTRLKRLARKTICFSKSLHMHKIMIGLLINVLEFGRALF